MMCRMENSRQDTQTLVDYHVLMRVASVMNRSCQHKRSSKYLPNREETKPMGKAAIARKGKTGRKRRAAAGSQQGTPRAYLHDCHDAHRQLHIAE